MPRAEDEQSFRRAVSEFEKHDPHWTFAFHFEEAGDFQEYVKRMEGWSKGVGVPDGFVPNAFFVAVVDRIVVGRLSLRHYLCEKIELIGGHIGYGVVPSYRRRGYATEMLRQAIPFCRSLGIERALITCDDSNVASQRVVEACGGVLETILRCPETGVPKRRYWLSIPR
jgi:predicted acetyltransferase